MKETVKQFQFYEFFAGAGMARLGLGKRWQCVWANDNDPRKVSLYEHNFGVGHIDSREVGKVARSVIAGASLSGSSRVLPLGADMAWASFPCQDLSLAGGQRGLSAGRSGSYWSFWKIMNALQQRGKRPPVLVIENVKGLLYGESFHALCASLAALGMRFGAVLADAKSFVPQSRPRVFIVAVDARVDTAGLSLGCVPDNPWFPDSVTAAHAGLPEALRQRWIWWDVEPPRLSPPAITSLIELEPSDVKYDSTYHTQHLLSLMTPRHRAKVDAARVAEGLQVGFLYRRTRNGQQRAEVRFDGIAGCLRTPKGGSSRQTVVVVRGGVVRTRLLSRIEAARLMGLLLDSDGRLPGCEHPYFPPGFSYNDAYFAMGDGVVVPVVTHLASTLLNELAERAARVCVVGNDDQGVGKNAFLAQVEQHMVAWSASQK